MWWGAGINHARAANKGHACSGSCTTVWVARSCGDWRWMYSMCGFVSPSTSLLLPICHIIITIGPWRPIPHEPSWSILSWSLNSCVAGSWPIATKQPWANTSCSSFVFELRSFTLSTAFSPQISVTSLFQIILMFYLNVNISISIHKILILYETIIILY